MAVPTIAAMNKTAGRCRHRPLQTAGLLLTEGARNAPLRSENPVYEAGGGTPPLQPQAETGAKGETPEQAGFEGAQPPQSFIPLPAGEGAGGVGQ